VAVVFPDAAVDSARHLLLPDLADEVRALSQKERDDAASSLTRAAAHLRDAGRTVTTAVRSGSAAIQLLQAAEKTGADLVVMGGRGISNIDRFLLGSVSERVLRHAHCSVLIVKA
jgi:nucleotide-binding universal stress UspA family protein